MPRTDTGDSFDAFLAEIAQTPDPPVAAALLPEALRSATVIGGRFRVEKRIGRGGMGEVYLATDTELNRSVAIKIAQSLLATVTGRVWAQEAEALARLSHPNVVEVFVIGETRGRPYIVMEWVDGETLADWVLGGRRWREVLACYRQAGAGLAAAHAAGLVHRDFKPHNAVRGADGRVRVVDFGLAAEIGSSHTESMDADAPPTRADGGSHLSRIDIGTAGYAAPEQHAEQDPDPRSDQFSFCAALYEAVFGRLPFVGTTLAALQEHKLTGTPSPPLGGIAPRWLLAALCRGLRATPGERYADMDALLRAIEPERHRRRRQAGLAMGGAAIVVALGVWLARASMTSPCDAVTAEIDAQWNQDRVMAVQSAFAATGSPLAEASTTYATTTLDEYAAQWSDQRQATCRDASANESVDAEASGKLACLRRAQTHLEATVDLLVSADRSTVANARELLDALPALSECRDAPALAGARTLSVARQLEVSSIRQLIAEADALRAAGHIRPALARAAQALQLARSSRFDPAIAEALVSHGTAMSAAGRGADGVPEFEEAYARATAARHDRVAAVAARGVLRHVVTDPRLVDEGQRWARTTEAAEQRLADFDAPSWMLLEARAQAATGAERYDRAALDFAAALAEQERQGVDVIHRVSLLCLLSVLEFTRARTADARSWADRAVALARDGLPPEHPVYAIARVRRGQAMSIDEPKAGLVEARAGLSILQSAYGPKAPIVVGALHTITNLLGRSGDARAAVANAHEAVEIVLARTPVDPIEEGIAQFTLGNALLDAGEPAAAERPFRRAADVYEETLGPDALDRGLVLITLGLIEAEREAYADADASLTEALQIIDPLVPDDSALLAGTLSNRGQVRVALHRPKDAMQDFDHALAVVARGGHRDVILDASLDQGRAFAYLALGDRARARVAARRSLLKQRAANPNPTIALVQSLLGTAAVLRQAGEPDQAEPLLREGLAALDAVDAGGTLRAELLLALAEVACAQGTIEAARGLTDQAAQATDDPTVQAQITATADWEDRCTP